MASTRKRAAPQSPGAVPPRRKRPASGRDEEHGSSLTWLEFSDLPLSVDDGALALLADEGCGGAQSGLCWAHVLSRRRGKGLARFETEDDAMRAQKRLNGSLVDGNAISVRVCVNPKKARHNAGARGQSGIQVSISECIAALLKSGREIKSQISAGKARNKPAADAAVSMYRAARVLVTAAPSEPESKSTNGDSTRGAIRDALTNVCLLLKLLASASAASSARDRGGWPTGPPPKAFFETGGKCRKNKFQRAVSAAQRAVEALWEAALAWRVAGSSPAMEEYNYYETWIARGLAATSRDINKDDSGPNDAALGAELICRWSADRIMPEDMQRRECAVGLVRRVAERVCQRVSVSLFGSTATGLATRESDVDILLFEDAKNETTNETVNEAGEAGEASRRPPLRPIAILPRLARGVEQVENKKSGVIRVNTLLATRVPITRLEWTVGCFYLFFFAALAFEKSRRPAHTALRGHTGRTTPRNQMRRLTTRRKEYSENSRRGPRRRCRPPGRPTCQRYTAMGSAPRPGGRHTKWLSKLVRAYLDRAVAAASRNKSKRPGKRGRAVPRTISSSVFLT